MKFSRKFVPVVAVAVVSFVAGAAAAVNAPAKFDLFNFDGDSSFPRDAEFHGKKFGQSVLQPILLPSGVEVAAAQVVLDVPSVVNVRDGLVLASIDVSRSVNGLGSVQVVNPVVVDDVVVNGVVVDGVSVASVVVNVPVVGSLVSGNGSVVAGLDVSRGALWEVSRDAGIA